MVNMDRPVLFNMMVDTAVDMLFATTNAKRKPTPLH